MIKRVFLVLLLVCLKKSAVCEGANPKVYYKNILPDICMGGGGGGGRGWAVWLLLIPVGFPLITQKW